MRDLLARAAQLSVSVHIAHLDPDLAGGWYPDERRVYLNFGLSPAEQRSTLAHELGHVYYGHNCDSTANEREADLHAARVLVDVHAYAALERVSDDVHFLAEELGVTTEVIETFRERCLTRMRGITYAHSRMGLGQHRLARAHVG